MILEEKIILKLGIGCIFEILFDIIDCNCIFFFVFIGNCFEFCVVGFLVNCVVVMIVINVVMVNQLNEFKVLVDKLMEEGIGKDEVIFCILKENIIVFEFICFEGDGYLEEWKQEVVCCGLINICYVLEVLMYYMDN